jgi:mRNA interferase MazF
MMLDLKNNDALLKMREQMDQKVKVDIKNNNNKLNNENITVNIHSNKLENDKVQVTMEINYKNIADIKQIEFKRKRIYWANIDGNKWSEQGGKCYPVICLSNDVGNKYSPTIIVGIITSQLNKSNIPTHVPLEGFGLPKNSVVLLEQIRTIDKRRITGYLGEVDEITMKKIDKAKDISMSELKPKSPLERLSINVQEIIYDKLDDIRSIERTICTIVNDDEYLKNNLYGQRECYLASLERICKKYDLDYHDYYTMYRREKEDKRIVV